MGGEWAKMVKLFFWLCGRKEEKHIKSICVNSSLDPVALNPTPSQNGMRG